MRTTSWIVRRSLALGFAVLGFGTLFAGGCDGDEDAAGSQLAFAGEDPLFPGFSYDTGLVPDGSPVQASFAVIAEGAASVKAEAVASGSEDAPTLTGVASTGEVAIGGSFGLEGRLVIDVSGLPSYDGPIPGIENVAIEFAGATPFDPFSIESPVTTRADIPPATLPEIPLPGGIPGSLVLEVAEGSFVEATLTGAQACVDGNEARYAVGIGRSGTVVIRPSIQIDVPVVGTKTFEIPTFEVPLSLGSTALAMTADVESFGAKPESGDHQSGACTGDVGVGGAGVGGAGGGASVGGGSSVGGSGGGDNSCTSSDDCGGLPCVEGTCSAGGGICESGTTLGDTALDACVSMSCCEHVETCTFDYSDIDGCNSCIDAGSGARCDGLIDCLVEHCNALPPAWACDIANYGAGDGCDCGCGALDPDCTDATVGSCDYCNTAGGCGTGMCPANIDPTNNAVCI